MIEMLVKLRSISLVFFKQFRNKMEKLVGFFSDALFYKVFCNLSKLSFGKLRKLIQPQTVKCVLAQETNQLFIEEVLLKMRSLMKKEMPTNINSLSNRILSTT